MVIKKLLYSIALSLFSLPIFAQTTNVTGTLVDPAGNTWVNAIVTAQFAPTPNTPPPFTWSGGSFNQQPPPVIAGGGTFNITLPSNNAIVPSGSGWQITVCPNATLPCAIVTVQLTGGTLNIVPILNAANAWPTGTVPGTFINKAYATAEVGPVPLNVGAMIYNTTTNVLEFWNGAVWSPVGTGSGTSFTMKLASLYCVPTNCSANNGAANAFGTTPNQSIITDSPANGDTTFYGIPQNSINTRWTSDGYYGVYMYDPIALHQDQLSAQVIANGSFVVSDIPAYVSGNDRGGIGIASWFVYNQTRGPGYLVANPNNDIPSGSLGQTGSSGFSETCDHARMGISTCVGIMDQVVSGGDTNSLRVYTLYGPGSIAPSTEGVTPAAFNIQQVPWAAGTITATTGTGDTKPTLNITNNTQGATFITVNGFIADTTAPSVAGTIVASNPVTISSVTVLSQQSAGSGMTPGLYNNVPSVGGGGTGATALIGVNSTNCTEYVLLTPGINYTSPPTFTPPAGGSPNCIINGSLNSYVNSMTVAGGAVTPSTGLAINNSAISGTTSEGVDQPQTFIASAQFHKALATGYAWFTNQQGMSEKILITSATITGTDQQSITAMMREPHGSGSLIIQGGSNGCFSLDADALTTIPGWNAQPTCYYAFGGPDSTHVYYYFVRGGGSEVVPIMGAEPASFTAPYNGYHIYQAAMVAQLDTHNAPTLVINDVPFAAGHNFTAIQNPALAIHGMNLFMQGNTPTNGTTSTGYAITYQGNFVSGAFKPLTFANFDPCNKYNECPGSPGLIVAPNTMTFQGPSKNIMEILTKPFEAVVKVEGQCNDPQSTFFSSAGGSLLITPDCINPGLAVSNNWRVAGNEIVNGTSSALSYTAAFDTMSQYLTLAQASTPTLGGSQFSQSFATGNLYVALGSATNLYQPPNTIWPIPPLDASGTLSLNQVAASIGYFGAQTPGALGLGVFGTTGTDTVSYRACAQTPLGLGGCSNVSISTANLATMGTGAAITGFAFANQVATITAVNSYTAGHFAVAYGMTGAAAFANNHILSILSSTGSTYTANIQGVANYHPAVPFTATGGTSTLNFVQSTVNPTPGGQTIMFARTSGTAGILCAAALNSEPGCIDYGQGVSGPVPPSGDTSGKMYVGGPAIIGGIGSSIATGVAVSDMAGEITLAGGTGTHTWAGTWTIRPECAIHDHTTPANDAANTYTVTNTGITINSSGSTDVIGWGCTFRQ